MNRRPTSSGFGLLALWLALVLTLGCASEAKPLWADPGLVHLDPDRTEVAIEIHNVSGAIRPIGEFELRGDDWGSLRFVDDSLPVLRSARAFGIAQVYAIARPDTQADRRHVTEFPAVDAVVELLDRQGSYSPG